MCGGNAKKLEGDGRDLSRLCVCLVVKCNVASRNKLARLYIPADGVEETRCESISLARVKLCELQCI